MIEGTDVIVDSGPVEVYWPAGTIVYLRSGGPPMTVTWYGIQEYRLKPWEGVAIDTGQQREVDVEWFVDGIVHRDKFLKASLTTTDPNQVYKR